MNYRKLDTNFNEAQGIIGSRYYLLGSSDVARKCFLNLQEGVVIYVSWMYKLVHSDNDNAPKYFCEEWGIGSGSLLWS
jgi:hypothetical protein